MVDPDPNPNQTADLSPYGVSVPITLTCMSFDPNEPNTFLYTVPTRIPFQTLEPFYPCQLHHSSLVAPVFMCQILRGACGSSEH